jgi:hypothetical protein
MTVGGISVAPGFALRDREEEVNEPQVGQIYFGAPARKWVRFQSALTGNRS